MSEKYIKYTEKINDIKTLRHYIDLEFSWAGAMMWIIVGISLFSHIGWWCLFVIWPIYRNIKLTILLFIQINKDVEESEKKMCCHPLEEVSK